MLYRVECHMGARCIRVHNYSNANIQCSIGRRFKVIFFSYLSHTKSENKEEKL